MDRTFSLDQIDEIAKEFWTVFDGRTVFAFHGDMGAGKTTFIQTLCRAKGVSQGLSSPTFSIINEYEYDCEGTKRVLFHMDLYRLKNEAEAIQAGVEEAFYSGYTCLVEWPEKAIGIFPDHTVHVYISLANNGQRHIKIDDI